MARFCYSLLIFVVSFTARSSGSWAYVPSSPLSARGLAQAPRPVRAVTTTTKRYRSGAVPRAAGSPCSFRIQGTHLRATDEIELAAPDEGNVKSLVSAAAFVTLDVAFRRLFQNANIAFPSSLGACGVVLAALLLLPDKSSDGIFDQLQPGALLLAKWLPVFFVPSLVALPLAGGLGSAAELIKVGSVVVGGFFFTLLTTAYSVSAVRRIRNKPSNMRTAAGDFIDAVADALPARKAFSDELFNFLCLSTAATGVAAVAIAGHWTALFLLSATLNSFVFGSRLSPDFKRVSHPLITCTALTWLAMTVLGALTHTSFRTILATYTLAGRGAGNTLLFFLGPAVVSLAMSMYERRKLMRENLAEVGSAIAVATTGGLYGTALAVRWLGLVSPALRLSLLSRNITSPLAMAIAGILGADVSLAVSMVVVTGLIGANFGAAILDAFGVKDAVARGLGIGAAAHGLGTAAFADEKEAFPFAAIAMALTATAAAATVSIPVVRKNLLQLALGA